MSKTQSADGTPIEETDDMSKRETGDVIQAGDMRLFVIERGKSFIGPPSIHVVSENGKQGRLATGVFHADTEEGGTAWVSDIEDKDRPDSDDLIAPYGDIHVIDNDASAIPSLLPNATDGRRCPECGECKYGGVFAFKLMDNDTLHEAYSCTGDECDTHYTHSRPFPNGDRATVHFYSREVADSQSASAALSDSQSESDTDSRGSGNHDDRGSASENPNEGEEYATEISGAFESRETDDWNQGLAQLMNQDDSPKGVWTASEVAEFINKKMNTSGEAERFGVAELGGGIGKYETRKRTNAPTWWDSEDSWDWVAKMQFVPVESSDDVTTIN